MKSPLTLLAASLIAGLPVLAALPAQNDIHLVDANAVRTLKHTIMHFTPDQIKAHLARRAALPKFNAPVETVYDLTHTVGDTMGIYLETNMNFTSCGGQNGWNQEQCGDCWVWGSTAACSIAYGVQTGTAQLFSVQWFNSDYYATESSQSACEGGDAPTFASWYESHKFFVPWTNTNAGFSDAAGADKPVTAASSISTTPNVPFTSITETEISTQTVAQATAIANIKAVLNANKAVTLSYFLNGAGWDDFETFWDDDSETTPWADVDKYNGTTMDSNGGGHLVCVVGYDNTNSSWVVLNSWGTTSGRPDDYFELPQAMNYADSMSDDGALPQYEFDYYTIVWPSTTNTVTAAITTPSANETVASAATVSFVGTGTDSATGQTLTYAWAFGDGTTGSGASTSHVYTNSGTAAVAETATLTVTDTTGAKGTATRTITVSPATTTNTVKATITAPAAETIATGTAVAFTGTATDSSSTATLTYAWNFGDGTTGTGATASHTYTNTGTAAVAYTATLTATDNTGAAGTATVVITVNPATVTPTQLILNPAFASGSTSWSASSDVIGKWGTQEAAYTGSYCAWLDGYTSAHTDYLSQAVTLPTTLHSATLNVWLHIDTSETVTTAKDLFTITLKNSSGTVLSTLATFSNLNKNTGYAEYTYAVPTSYAGQKITVYFQAVQAGSKATDFVVGQVNLNVQ
jgi:hypothetical protein